MNTAVLKSSVNEIVPASPKIKVIGSGPAGLRFAQELLDRHPYADITVFGNEPYQPYNRVQLTAFLAGEVERSDIDIPMPNPETYPNFRFEIASIKAIHRDRKVIEDIQGNEADYDYLVMATGARAHKPSIEGVDKHGVYTFRNLKDAEFLFARKITSRHIVVVGGGLLGIEAAKALSKLNTKITLIHQGPHLMNRQLDTEAAGVIQTKLESDGIYVITESGVRVIHGKDKVTGVRTRSGAEIFCDTVVLCAGITPNVELALNAKLPIRTGVIVDDQLQTADESIFAIGECSEHRGQTYGLVNPGYEQAAVAAEVISREYVGLASDEPDLSEVNYAGSLAVSRLKVLGQSVCSMGQVTDLPQRPRQKELKFRRRSKGIERKAVIYKGQLIGAAGTGEWEDASRFQEAYQTGRRIWWWQYIWFYLKGSFWLFGGQKSIQSWPEDAIVCQCNSLTKGSLIRTIEQGAQTLEVLQAQTRAGTVCGSCKPLLGELMGSDAPADKEKDWLPLAIGGLLASIIVACILLIPEAKTADSVQADRWFESIWNDKFYKQVTGFTLLGLSVLGLLMSLRKRFGWERMGSFNAWRILHVLLGVACAGVLIFHTGFHLGSNLNQLLLFDFLGVLILGSIAGWIAAVSYTLKPAHARRLRSATTWMHILVTWPLPILLGIHILTVYYY